MLVFHFMEFDSAFKSIIIVISFLPFNLSFIWYFFGLMQRNRKTIRCHDDRNVHPSSFRMFHLGFHNKTLTFEEQLCGDKLRSISKECVKSAFVYKNEVRSFLGMSILAIKFTSCLLIIGTGEDFSHTLQKV